MASDSTTTEEVVAEENAEEPTASFLKRQQVQQDDQRSRSLARSTTLPNFSAAVEAKLNELTSRVIEHCPELLSAGPVQARAPHISPGPGVMDGRPPSFPFSDRPQDTNCCTGIRRSASVFMGGNRNRQILISGGGVINL